MRVLHFDCFSGISGDMTLGALIDAGVDVGLLRDGLASLGLPIRLEAETVRKGGFAATRARVEAPEETEHRHLPDVEAIINRAAITPSARDLALRVFRRLAEAEAAAHGMPLDRVHFHEVGALDSIADIVGVAIGVDSLGVGRVTSRSVPPGSGTVKCAHGVMPVPAPGTAALLKGVPLAASPVKGELTTPTGAAILTSLVTAWQDQPVMTVERIGSGAGLKDFVDQPNILRIFIGTTVDDREPGAPGADADRVWVLETNLDDLPAELIGYTVDALFHAGALDVFTVPIFMKKNRPGVLLTAIAPEAAVSDLETILFRETTTFGVRRYPVSRRKLHREPCMVTTPWGPVRGKLGWLDGRPPTFAPEYEDCAAVARRHDVPLREVYEQARRVWQAGRPGAGLGG